MKIADVKCYELRAEVKEPFTSSRGWRHDARVTNVVEIITADGISGWGEAFGPSSINRAIVEDLIRPRLIGRDPFDVEVIWEETYNRLKDYGATGLTISALSSVDIALWDLIGKDCGKPIHKLIGGAFRSHVQAYATGMYFRDMERVVDDAVTEAQKYVSQGFRAMKMKIGLGDIERDRQRIAAVREAIGPKTRLMVDANHCFTVPAAIKLGRYMQELDVGWFEEPISPEDVDGYALVSQALDMPIAGGENLFTRYAFRDFLTKKAMDIVQPDVCCAGGFTECKKITAMAHAHGVECVPHAWGSAIGLAATLQLIASIPDMPPSLIPMPVLLEFEQMENPLRDLLAQEPIVQNDSLVAIPTKPGLGIEIDRSILQRFKKG